MSAFKAYDIRGVYGTEITEELAYRIGYHLPKLLKTDHVVVGRDIRLSSPSLHDALVKGITDSGNDVWDLGLSTTPMVYFATAHLGADASVQITASHNPPQYNGFKISRHGALPVGGDSGLKDLEKMVNEEETPVSAKKGEIKDYSHVRDEYVAFLKPFAEKIEGLNISVDCSSGMSALIIKDLQKGNVHYINDTFDGSFPAHEPNPLEEKNCKQIEAETVKNGSDAGIIYDGDADRVMFIDEKGRFIQPDYITAVIGLYYSKLRGMTGNALVDIRTSRSTTEFLEKLGYDVTVWKVGHAFAKMKIREIDGVFGGELAGHYYIREFFSCDSGILASLFVLSVVKMLKDEGKTLSSLIDSIICYSNSGEINFRLEEKDEAIDALYRRFAVEGKPSALLDFDGYRIEYPDWWFNVRKSNTEPYLRIVAEASDSRKLDEKLDEIKSIIGKFH